LFYGEVKLLASKLNYFQAQDFSMMLYKVVL